MTFIANVEQILLIVMVIPLLTLNKSMSDGRNNLQQVREMERFSYCKKIFKKWKVYSSFFAFPLRPIIIDWATT